MKLHEIVKSDFNAPKNVKEREIYNWLRLGNETFKFEIASDGEIDIFGDTIINGDMLKDGKLPYKFNEVKGDFFITDAISLEGCPKKVSDVFDCSHSKIKTLEGINDIIKECEVFTCFGLPYLKSGGLGLLLIKELRNIRTDRKPLEIIAKYLGKGHDVLFDCQDELIENGYGEFAKL